MGKVFCMVLCIMFFSEVMSWTVDLGEVKKIFLDNEVQSDENSDEIINNENDLLGENYARNFGYQGYKEKEASSIIRNGSVYLEGLSKALMTYRNTLYKCSLNKTNSKANSQLKEKSNEILSTCGAATNNSEYVQKLSELALLTTNKLRDKAYDNKDYKNDARNENELLLQLAWLLDRLAYLTGYEPNPKEFIETETSTFEINENDATEKIDTGSLELLEQTENGRPLSKLPPKQLTAVKSIKKRSAEPLENVMKYYVKYKVWNSSNQFDNFNDKGDKKLNFDVQNVLTVRPISKRSVKRKFIIRRNKRRMKTYE
ncbi:uncharacterized protein LOC126779797 [Nymphalis io]|uniref:uncharacterized protein LOC126779797 n=1 Tax=Inachis io TaxID=171585 RepID=UPI0021683D98|nr:uncharacterized protein LOC126779797 [Nymphalis io]